MNQTKLTKVRADKWLWAARIFFRAPEACAQRSHRSGNRTYERC